MQWPADRRHPRIEAFLPAQCAIFSQGLFGVRRTPIEGKTRYVSPGGAMLLLPISLPLYSRLTVCLGKGVEVRARVVWTENVFRTDLGMVKGHGIAFMRDLDTATLKHIINGEQKQREPRILARLPVTYEYQDRAITGTCLNLSQSGMFIGTPYPLRTGEELFMHIAFAGLRQPISLASQVVWSNPLESSNAFAAGMGVRFMEMESMEAMHLSTLLEQLRPRTFSPAFS